jgi:hypothetical protein
LSVDVRGSVVIASISNDGAGPFIFEISDASDGRFTIKNAGLYQCAEPNGSLACNRKIASHWEQFSFSIDLPGCLIPSMVANAGYL